MGNSALSKALTLARQELLSELKKLVETPYDEIYFLKDLVLSGHFNAARRFFTQLEKFFEHKQKWQHLELLYIEASRLCQATGNIRLSGELQVRRTKNAARLKSYIESSAVVNDYLFRMEVYAQQNSGIAFERQLEKAGAKAKATGHFTLMQNALMLRYLYFSRHSDQHKKVKEIAEEIFSNQERNGKRMDDITVALARNTWINYVSAYSGKISRRMEKDVKRRIAVAGRHATFNFYYSLLDYYLFGNNARALDALLQEIREAEDNTRFTVYRQGIYAMKSFTEGNISAFKNFTRAFFKNPARLDFPETECMLRIMEALNLHAEEKTEDALYKLNALRVFMARRLGERYRYEQEVVTFLTRHFSRPVKPELIAERVAYFHRSPYRNIRFLAVLLGEKLQAGKKNISV